MTESSKPPFFNEQQISEMIGKRMIIGLTYIDGEGHITSQSQYLGFITRINPKEGVVYRLDGTDKEFALPPDPRGYCPAKKGTYRFRTTKQDVINPEYMSMWKISKAGTPDCNFDIDDKYITA